MCLALLMTSLARAKEPLPITEEQDDPKLERRARPDDSIAATGVVGFGVASLYGTTFWSPEVRIALGPIGTGWRLGATLAFGRSSTRVETLSVRGQLEYALGNERIAWIVGGDLGWLLTVEPAVLGDGLFGLHTGLDIVPLGRGNATFVISPRVGVSLGLLTLLSNTHDLLSLWTAVLSVGLRWR